MCLVCKNLYHLAITHLYRTLAIGPRYRGLYEYLDSLVDGKETKKSRETQWSDFCALVRRLVEHPNREQVYAVREVEVVEFEEGEEDFASDLEKKDALAMLVKALPNLQRFRSVSPSLSRRRLCPIADEQLVITGYWRRRQVSRT